MNTVMNEALTDAYNARMQEMAKLFEDSEFVNDLELHQIAQKKIDDIYGRIEATIGRKIYADFNFRSGHIMGILRALLQNPKHRDELLKATGLSFGHIDGYYRFCGNLPYLAKDTGAYVEGRPMNVKMTKQLILHTAYILGVYMTEDDVSDITQERWDMLYNRKKIELLETASYTDKDTVQYDE